MEKPTNVGVMLLSTTGFSCCLKPSSASSRAGGDSSAVQHQLVDVQCLCASTYALAALKRDGSVVTWGDASAGGDSSAVQEGHRAVGLLRYAAPSNSKVNHVGDA